MAGRIGVADGHKGGSRKEGFVLRNCQVCGNENSGIIYPDYNNGIMARGPVTRMDLHECARCGHRFLDGPGLSQEWFDNYYLTEYRTDDKPYSQERLDTLAGVIRSYRAESILDIGGTDGELISRTGGIAAGISDWPSGPFELIVLSHTLEHIYSIDSLFSRIRDVIIPGGTLVIEGPIHPVYYPPASYDYHWQHINKFRTSDIIRVVERNGFDVLAAVRLANYREYFAQRIEAQACAFPIESSKS